VGLEDRVDLGPVAGGDIGDDQVLVRGQAQPTPVQLGDLAQPIQKTLARPIVDPAALDEQGAVVAAVFAARPAEGVAVRGEGIRAGGLHGKAKPGFDLRLDPGQSLVVDRIFEARPGAIPSVAEIALDGHDRIDDREHLIGRHEADEVRQPRIGGGCLVGSAHAAADDDVEPFQALRPGYGDEAQVLGVDVNVIGRRDDEADLEFPRHVGLAVEGLLGFRPGQPLIAVPDLVIGPHARDRVVARPRRQGIDLGVKRRQLRVDRAHDAARVVAAG
jgi:hypothetical protein